MSHLHTVRIIFFKKMIWKIRKTKHATEIEQHYLQQKASDNITALPPAKHTMKLHSIAQPKTPQQNWTAMRRQNVTENQTALPSPKHHGKSNTIAFSKTQRETYTALPASKRHRKPNTMSFSMTQPEIAHHRLPKKPYIKQPYVKNNRPKKTRI